MTLLVALGDSTSCGEGVGLCLPPSAVWPARLARALPHGRLLALAVAGARVHDVVAGQLEAAVGSGADVATVLVGLNDVSRPGFDAAAVQAHLVDVVGALRAAGAAVLLGRLHDPTALLPLPSRLAAAVRARADAVNAGVDACTGPGVHVLDLARVPGLRSRRAWDLDRLHPSAAGHALLAAAAAGTLRRAGVPVQQSPPVALPPPPSLLREGWWALRHGLPYAVRRVGAGA